MGTSASAAVQYSLTVTKSGTGAGTITSNPAGIDCGSTCSASFDEGTTVTLMAAAAPGSEFAGWSGDCSSSGTSTTCTLTMDAGKNVSASFEQLVFPPDALIRRSTSSTYVGQDVFNTTGVHQHLSTDLAWGASAAFLIKVENDGNTPDSFEIKGPGRRHHLIARYLNASGQKITSAVIAGTYRTPTLDPGKATVVRLVVLLRASTPAADPAEWLVTASSVTQPLGKDAVKASITPNVYAEDRPGNFSPAVAGDPERVYVPDNNTNSVFVINPNTFRVVKRFGVGAVPQHITPGWDLKQLYVENSYSASLTVINPRTASPVKTLHGIPGPYNLYFTPDGNKALNIDEEGERVEFRNPHTWALLGSVNVPWPGVDHGDFTANGRYILMSTEYSPVVVKIDTVRMKLVGVVHVGGNPIDVKVSPDGKRFYVANQGTNGVSVIDPDHMKVTKFIPTGNGAHGLAISRDTTRLYVANRREGTISVISFAKQRVVSNWHVGGTPDMLQVSPDGTQLWASNRYNGSVSVINTRTGHVIKVIRTGIKPHGLAYFPQPGRYSVGHNGVYR
jgi:YVTN family beta-propeller protein